MVVCVCKRVSDGQIRTQVAAGAETLREVSRTLGVGTQCGRCIGCAREIISEARLTRQSVTVALPAAAAAPAH